jgi:hypothetical protein
MCANLLESVGAGYSYGIAGYDGWGCELARRYGVTVHQYDCFDGNRPACAEGDTLFHDECVAPERGEDEAGRVFDSLENHLLRNGDGADRIVLKMDVEGAEWDSLLATPEHVLARIEQIAIELHGVGETRFIQSVWKLKQQFHVAHLHFNNFSCRDGVGPFPADAYEVLFVNKRIGVLASPDAPARPHVLDAPNDPDAADCQQ